MLIEEIRQEIKALILFCCDTLVTLQSVKGSVLFSSVTANKDPVGSFSVFENFWYSLFISANKCNENYQISLRYRALDVQLFSNE